MRVSTLSASSRGSPRLTMRTTARMLRSPLGPRSQHTIAAIETDVKGVALLNSPRLNKGSAFPHDERETFDLHGLLPYAVNTLEQQTLRATEQLGRLSEPIAKHEFLDSMRQQNQVLFFNLLRQNLKKLLPIVYTPTVGQAIQEFSHRFRRPEGVTLSFPNRERMERDLLLHGGKDDIDLIVVTDGEGILGIGDQGVGGIGICGGKTALYTCAGVDPNRVLSIVLDVGTDNHALYDDELYLGWRNARIRGKDYDDFIAQFVKICSENYPNALIHFEDFGVKNASRILRKYKDEASIFNDDIQGTGATALAALLSALKVTGEKLEDQRIVIHGAGTAGAGIADRLAIAMSTQAKISYDEAAKRFYLIDRQGLLVKSMESDIRPGLEPFLRDDAEVKDWARAESDKTELRLIDVVKSIKPTVLIGTSTQPRAFNEDIVKEMAKHVERPIILPLSNPTSRCEADPASVAQWTDHKALVACGSPFPPVERPDGTKAPVAECNNALIYPGLGLGVILSKAKKLSESMIVSGVEALAKLSPALEDPAAPLLPDLGNMREISAQIASAVMLAAKREGQAVATVEDDEEARLEHIREVQWQPVYRPLRLRDAQHALQEAEVNETSSRRPGDLGGDGPKAKE